MLIMTINPDVAVGATFQAVRALDLPRGALPGAIPDPWTGASADAYAARLTHVVKLLERANSKVLLAQEAAEAFANEVAAWETVSRVIA